MPYQLSLCSGLKEHFSQAHSALLGTWQAINESEFPQLCPTLCDPMDYTVPGILQARILEWVAFPFSRESSQFRDQTQDSCIAGRCFTSWASRLNKCH